MKLSNGLLLDRNLSKITFVNRKKVTVTKLRYIFFFIFIILNTYASWMFHAKIQSFIRGSGEEINFVMLAAFK